MIVNKLSGYTNTTKDIKEKAGEAFISPLVEASNMFKMIGVFLVLGIVLKAGKK